MTALGIGEDVMKVSVTIPQAYDLQDEYARLIAAVAAKEGIDQDDVTDDHIWDYIYSQFPSGTVFSEDAEYTVVAEIPKGSVFLPPPDLPLLLEVVPNDDAE